MLNIRIKQLPEKQATLYFRDFDIKAYLASQSSVKLYDTINDALSGLSQFGLISFRFCVVYEG